MKQTLFYFTVLLTTSLHSYSQTETQSKISFDGIYTAKTGGVPAANIEIFTYLRFYEDGTVCLQAVSSNDPETVSKWFGRDKKFSQKGKYKIDGSNIILQLNNKTSEDSKLEGFVETNYKGATTRDNQLCLIRDKELEEKCFVFYKTP